MVEQTSALDYIFASLSDPTRRDILKKVSKKSLSVGEIAAHYPLTFAAVAKHVEVLRRAKLIQKSRQGREQIISISPRTLLAASNYLESYQQLWKNRLDSLDNYLSLIHKPKRGK